MDGGHSTDLESFLLGRRRQNCVKKLNAVACHIEYFLGVLGTYILGKKSGHVSGKSATIKASGSCW